MENAPHRPSTVVVTLGAAAADQPGNNPQISFHPVGTAPDITLTAAGNNDRLMETLLSGLERCGGTRSLMK